MNEANFDNVYLPDPANPISIAFPLGYLRILAVLIICSIAYLNKTKSNLSL